MTRIRSLWLVASLLLGLAARLLCAAPSDLQPRLPAPCRRLVQVGGAWAAVSCLDSGPPKAGWVHLWPPPCRHPPPLTRLQPGDRVLVRAGRCQISRMAAPLLQTLGLPVALNRANAAELQTLPGVGPALARRILATRRLKGPFARPADLLKVRGVGPRLLARIQSRLLF